MGRREFNSDFFVLPDDSTSGLLLPLTGRRDDSGDIEIVPRGYRFFLRANLLYD